MKHTCLHETDIANVAKDVSYIRKALEGNGEVGIIGKVHKNSKFRYGMTAQIRLWKIITGSGWAFTLFLWYMNSNWGK